MKGMRIAIVVIAVLVVVALGVTLMSSGESRSRRTATTATPAQTTRVAPPAAAKPAGDKPAIQVKPDGKRTIAAPPIKTPLGMDTSAEEKKLDELDALAQQSYRDGNYDRAIEQRREQNKSAAKLGNFVRSGPIYMEIARAQIQKGEYKAAVTDLDSVLVMASVGSTQPNDKVADDVQVLRASLALAQGDIDGGEKALNKAREMRVKAEGADDFSNAEILAHEALIADMRGKYADADQKMNDAIVKMMQARVADPYKYMFENNIWMLKKMVANRTGKATPEEIKSATERLEKAQEVLKQ